MTKDITVGQVGLMTREKILDVESAFNATRLAGEKFFSELPMEERTRFAEVASRYATLQAQEQIKVLREALERISGFTMSQFLTVSELASECQDIARQALEATNG